VDARHVSCDPPTLRETDRPGPKNQLGPLEWCRSQGRQGAGFFTAEKNINGKNTIREKDDPLPRWGMRAGPVMKIDLKNDYTAVCGELFTPTHTPKTRGNERVDKVHY